MSQSFHRLPNGFVLRANKHLDGQKRGVRIGRDVFVSPAIFSLCITDWEAMAPKLEIIDAGEGESIEELHGRLMKYHGVVL